MDEQNAKVEEITALKKEIIKECIEVIRNTPTNHAYTTFDIGIIKGTIERAVKHVKEHFGL